MAITKRSVAFYYPHSFARYVSKKVFDPFDFQKHISKRIVANIELARQNNEVRILVVNAPPQHGKSEFISKWVPTWFLSFYQDKRVILTSYEAAFAASWGAKVRDEITRNPDIPLSIIKTHKAKSEWGTEQGGWMFTGGAGGALTGKGGDLIIIDDPVKNFDDAKSHVKQETNANWFDSVVFTRAQPGTVIILLMTRWHEKDLTPHILKKADSLPVEHIVFRAISEGDDPLGRKEGEALVPTRFDTKALELRKASIPVTFAGLYQQRPTNLEGGIIKRDWLRFHDHDLTFDPASHAQIFDVIIQSWDCNFKETQKGSFAVGQVWAKSGPNFYLLYQFRERCDYVKLKNQIRWVSNTYIQATNKYIEDKANGSAVISDLSSEVTGLVPVGANQSKESRLVSISGLFAAGNVHLPNPDRNPWVRDYIEELVNFPNSENDDQVDATSQALDQLKIVGNYKPFDDIDLTDTFSSLADDNLI